MKFFNLNFLIKPRFVGVLITLLTGCLLWLGGLNLDSGDWHNCVLEPLSPFFNIIVPPNSFFSHLLGLCAALFCGILFYFFNESFLFIKERTLLPFFLFVLIMGSNPNVHQFSPAYLSCLFLLLVFWQLFFCYKGASPVRQCFNMGLLLALGSMVCIELVLFLLPMWIGMQRLNVFNLRTFFASLIGFLCPYIFALSIVYVFYDVNTIINVVWSSVSLEYLSFDFSVSSLIYLGAIFVCMIISIFYCIAHSVGNRMHVIRMQSVLSICFFLSFILFFLIPGKPDVTFPILAMFAALSLSNYFTMSKGLSHSIVFYVFIACLLVLYISLT